MGPEKMQSSARHFGTLWRSVTEFREKAEQQVREAMPDLDLPRIPTSPRGALAGYVTDLFTTPPATPSASPAEIATEAESPPRDHPPSVVTPSSVPRSPAALPADDVSMN
jgi:hypothetical protein